MSDFITRITESLQKSDQELSKLPLSIYGPELRGMSSPKVRHFFNNLCSFPDTRYLEIGSFCGSTLLSASYDNGGTFVAIDNHTWKTAGDFNARQTLSDNRQKHAEHCKTIFIEGDCWKIDQSQFPCQFNVYFFDGDHQPASQCKALTDYMGAVDDPFIFIVDDWRDNGPDKESGARQGTYKGIKGCNLEIVYEIEAPIHEYWNGLGIFVLRKR